MQLILLRKIVTIIIFMAFSIYGFAQSPAIIHLLKEGDIIFQKIPCGDLCDAIIETTTCRPGKLFNHCGIVHFKNGSPFVIEAIGKAVQESTLEHFLKRDSSGSIYIGRVKEDYNTTPAPAVERAHTYIGTPYDNAFLPGDSALYCSELVYDCYKKQDGTPLFSLQPMTFVSPKTRQVYPAWVTYYNHIHHMIPEGLPGINPCAIANANVITFMAIPNK